MYKKVVTVVHQTRATGWLIKQGAKYYYRLQPVPYAFNKQQHKQQINLLKTITNGTKELQK